MVSSRDKWEDFAKLIKMGKSDGELLEKLFLFFPKKLWMRNLDWELLELLLVTRSHSHAAVPMIVGLQQAWNGPKGKTLYSI